jgi:hypothetical protein
MPRGRLHDIKRKLVVDTEQRSDSSILGEYLVERASGVLLRNSPDHRGQSHGGKGLQVPGLTLLEVRIRAGEP